jgi:hypothetical protein
VVASALKRYAWPTLAGLALIYLVALAATGGRPGPGLAPFEPKGLMRHIALDSIKRVEMTAEAQQWHLERAANGTWRLTSGPPVTKLEENLSAALTLLHNSAPERILSGHDLAPTSLREFGLEQPHLRVAVHSMLAEPFVITFGGTNALGSVRYARIEGRDDVVLLPAFCAEAWEHLMGKQ